MNRKVQRISLIIVTLIAFFAVSLSAANKPLEKKKRGIKIDRTELAKPADESVRDNNQDVNQSSSTHSVYGTSSISPGVTVGHTWYDYQQNGSMGRMVDHGPHSGVNGYQKVYFGWMDLPGAVLAYRHYSYNYYDAQNGSWGGPHDIQGPDEYAGYVGVDVTPDNQIVIGGHDDMGSGYAPTIYSDLFSFYSCWTRVEDSTMEYGGTPGQQALWPKIRIQYGSDTVIHVIAQISSGGGAEPALYYFRSTGGFGYCEFSGPPGPWDYPPYIVDTNYTVSHDIAASRTSDKVAIVWLANLNYDNNGVQYPPGLCDTCSGESPIHIHYDNDVYYQISNDQGLTWQPRVNVTKNRLGEAGFRPYTDLSALIDTDDNLHILYSAVYWPADPLSDGWGFNSRLFHWSENNPFIRTVADANWDPTICTPGAWNINISKMSVSECDGKIYALWTQFNDGNNGIFDDCAAWATQSNNAGAANGELWLSVSSDGGLTWDDARNLTNSYTPNCNPSIGYPCESDNWPSMERYGSQEQAGEDWSGAVVVDPSGSYGGNNYLNVQYIHDPDAGGMIQGEGSWQLADVNWFRLACVEPVPNPQLSFNPNNISDPTWTQPGIEKDIDLTLENNGNVGLSYSVSVEEDNGQPGWLGYSGLSGSVPAGLSNIETGTLRLNKSGVETSDPIVLHGRLIFTSNAPSSPDTLEVSLIVASDVQNLVIDTLYTSCLALAFSNNGNYGHQGEGGVNLDWTYSGTDCDTTADVYLYDGSPIIMWVNGNDTVGYWSMYGDSWYGSHSFRPIGEPSHGYACDFMWSKTGVFITQDSTIGLEQSWFATYQQECDFIIKKLKVWSFDGQAHNGLRIGEAVDWDIPSDSSNLNTSGFDFSRNLIYQSGAEFDSDDTLNDGSINPQGNDCIDADRRFGGIAFYGSFLNASGDYTNPYNTDVFSAYTSENDRYVFPNGNFLPGELWQNMNYQGFSVSDSTKDLHTVMCYEPNLNLGVLDTLEFYTIYASVYDGTITDLQTIIDSASNWIPNSFWIPASCCCGISGDINGDGGIDIADLVYFVNYAFAGGPVPDCLEEADCDGDGTIDIEDIVCLITYMFGDGPEPSPCH